MNTNNSIAAIPQDIAYQLCADIRAEGKRKWYTWSAWWCWGGTTFTSCDPAKRCGATVACPQIVDRYARQNK